MVLTVKDNIILLDLALVSSTSSKSASGFILLYAGNLCLLWDALSCCRRTERRGRSIDLFDAVDSGDVASSLGPARTSISRG